MTGTMAEPKKSKSQPATDTGRTGAALGITIDPALRQAVNEFIAHYNAEHDHRATVTSTVEAALKKYLSAEGFWPPKR